MFIILPTHSVNFYFNVYAERNYLLKKRIRKPEKVSPNRSPTVLRVKAPLASTMLGPSFHTLPSVGENILILYFMSNFPF
jgi:hypothetical protein